jgi:hypothetical protein
LIGTISSTNRPSSIASIAFRCELAAHSSISSRVTFANCAVFQPTVSDMSVFDASTRSGWDGGSHESIQSSVPGLRHLLIGAVERDSTPPAMTAQSMPARIDAAATDTADRLVAQCRFIARPGTVSMPLVRAACRAMTPPPYVPSPRMTSSMSAAGTPPRLSEASTTACARSYAKVSVSVPFQLVPMAVRHAATTTH